MDNLANEMDQVMARLERAAWQCAPSSTPRAIPTSGCPTSGAVEKLAKSKGETIAYDTLLQAWKAGKVR